MKREKKEKNDREKMKEKSDRNIEEIVTEERQGRKELTVG